jgi:hypothetical protein
LNSDAKKPTLGVSYSLPLKGKIPVSAGGGFTYNPLNGWQGKGSLWGMYSTIQFGFNFGKSTSGYLSPANFSGAYSLTTLIYDFSR